MTEQELLSQLNNLKNIKPDSQWKTGNREILLNQISSSQEEVRVSWLASLRSGFRILENMLPHSPQFGGARQLIRQLSQPVWAVVLIMVIVFGGGIVSLNASRDTKPGDSLYIAKVISEKTQLAITFNEKEKVKLGIEFAGNRTKEITQVLAEADNVIKEKEAKVEKLSQNFKKEINTVKSRLVKINAIQRSQDVKCEENFTDDELNITTDETIGVFSANLEKSDQRMEISEPSDLESTVVDEQQSDSGAQDQVELVADSAGGDSEDFAVSAVEQANDVTKVLEEAEKLFDEKDYNGTLDKLTEANNIIDQTGANSSIEAQDTASTTDNMDATGDEAEDKTETASSTGE
ncbi:hypothetical protein KAU19_03185 [Candidatus Parcubacteria bacterium]|nr:hypothetical protein [Candidatus Parcubacteria bacterium]